LKHDLQNIQRLKLISQFLQNLPNLAAVLTAGRTSKLFIDNLKKYPLQFS